MNLAEEAAKLKAGARTNWADATDDDASKIAPSSTESAAKGKEEQNNNDAAPAPSAGKSATAADIAELAKKLDLAAAAETPDLYTGELTVRQAGAENEGEFSVERVTSFLSLPIDDRIKKAITEVKGWQSLSKIQQIGLPLILADPPANIIGQAQAGTGKTGTFTIGLLSRIDTSIDPKRNPSRPQAIVLAGTQELVTQIAMEVNALGRFLGVKARRVMSSRSKKARDPSAPKAAWEIPRGEDFFEQVVVGTPGMVKNYLRNAAGRKKRKPCIDASNVRVVVFDDADSMCQLPPVGFGEDTAIIKRDILKARKGKVCQFLLFSATFNPEILPRVRSEYMGGSKKLYSEITLKKGDDTLTKVANFFIKVGGEHDDESTKNAHKDQAILDIWESLSALNLGQTVIFVNRKTRAQQLAEFLRSNHYTVGQIHGDMEKMERETVFKEFKEGKRSALVATNVLSRGIDNQNVTLVINVDLPMVQSRPDPDTYVHRIGRAGRWTKKGAAVSLVSPNMRFNELATLAQIEREKFSDAEGILYADRQLIECHDAKILGEQVEKLNLMT